MRKNKAIILIILILLVIIAICFLPWTHRINKTLSGFEKQLGNGEYNKKVTITVRGSYKQYILKNDKFEGSISSNIYGEIWNKSHGEIIFRDNIGYINYVGVDDNGFPRIEDFGMLICNSNVDEILVLAYQKIGNTNGWSGEDGLYISAPAKNKEEVIKVAKKLSNNNAWLSNIIWE